MDIRHGTYIHTVSNTDGHSSSVTDAGRRSLYLRNQRRRNPHNAQKSRYQRRIQDPTDCHHVEESQKLETLHGPENAQDQGESQTGWTSQEQQDLHREDQECLEDPGNCEHLSRNEFETISPSRLCFITFPQDFVGV
jgi:hypothetical protein